jgi:hypothetical protein
MIDGMYRYTLLRDLQLPAQFGETIDSMLSIP